MMQENSAMRLPTGPQPKARIAVLIAILALAAWLRLPGTFYPVPLHFDEGVYISNVLCQSAPSGTYYHPFLNRYLLRIAEADPCVRAWLRHSPRPGSTAVAEYAADRAPFLARGRLISLLSGLAAIAVVYLLGTSLGSPATGLLAGLLLAVSPTNVALSNNLGPWALAVLMSGLVLLSLARLRGATHETRALLLLGASLGLALATVYPLAVLLVPVLLVFLSRWRERRAAGGPPRIGRDLLLVTSSALLVHCVANFTALTHAALTLREIFVPESSRFNADSVKVGYLRNVGWYFGSVLDELGMTWTIGLLGLAGLLYAALKQRGLWLAMLVFAVLVLFAQPAVVLLMANRFTSPLTPVLAVAAAALLVQLGAWLRAAVPARWHAAVFGVLVALVVLPALATDLAYRRALALPPTRVLALQWIEKNIPAGSAILQSIEYMTPTVLDCALLEPLQDEAPQGRPCYRVSFAPRDPELYHADFMADVARSGADYLIYNESTPLGTIRRLGRPRPTPAALRERYTLLVRFEHPGLDRFHDDTTNLNPAVEIYRLRP
jgi:hypothetical protein